MVAVQNQFKQLLLKTQIGMLNNTYKTSNNQGIKNAAVTQLKPAVNQAETLQQEAQAAPQAGAGAAAATSGNVAAGGGPAGGPGKVSKDGWISKQKDPRSEAKREYDKNLIKELNAEFGIGNKTENARDWARLADKSDAVDFYSKDGKKLDGTGKDMISSSLLVVNSKKYGQVKIAVGGDYELNGGDDTVLSVGGKAAANSAQDGLAKTMQPDAAAQQAEAAEKAQAKFQDIKSQTYDQASCPICKGKGCPNCTGAISNQPQPAQTQQVAHAAPAAPQAQAISPLLMNNAAVDEAKDIIANHKPEAQGIDISKIAEARNLAGTGEVQKLAGKNDEVAGLVGKSENAYTMDKDQINNLIAALMLVISGPGNFK